MQLAEDELADDIRLVLNLNGDVLFPPADDPRCDDLPEQYSDGRTPVWAQGVLDAYHLQLSKPEQATFFTSEAA